MNPTAIRATAALAAIALFVSACGSDDDNASSQTTEEAAESQTTAPAINDASSGDAASSDIVDTAVGAGSFDTLVAAVQAAGLEETLRGDGPFTVFAPSDAAFDTLPEGTVESLLDDPTGDLSNILTYHVVEGRVMADDVGGLDGEQVTTVNGDTFTVNVVDGSVSLTDGAGNEIGVVDTDIETSNGVIHVLDGVLIPA